jgi:ribose transport system ATP-binding protein
MSEPRLNVRALKKSFGANSVLRGLDLALEAGEIHALVGGNGAGKSTLSKIIAGIETRDAGTIELDGVALAAESRRAAQRAGVVMVLQELSVLPTLSVAENLLLDALPTGRIGLIDRTRLRAAAKEALTRVGLTTLDPDTPAAALGVGHQQLVEIAAGLAQRCRLLILDEPTAALTGAEIATLFTLLRTVRANGTTILYISHRLDEIATLADRVSVLRDGQLVATLPVAEAPRDRLIELMAGAPLAAATGAAREIGQRPIALRVTHARVGRAVRDVSLDVHAGEMVGLGGLVGAGRTELLRAIFGAEPLDGGTLQLGAQGWPYAPRSTREAVARGLAFVPEDRKHHGIFGRLAVKTNAMIAALSEVGADGFVSQRREDIAARDLLGRLGVRYADARQPIVELSGGNQQKIVIGRWMQRDVRLWLLDEPTRGVDVPARRSIYALLRERAAAGEAMLVASSDYEELATLCDRVIVLSNGIVGGEFTAATLNPEAFTAAAFAGFERSAA